MQPLHTPRAPEPLGHYVQAQRTGNLLFLSTQLPVVPGTGAEHDPHALRDASPADQARQVLANMGAILAEAGCGPEHVVRLTIYLTRIEDWDEVNGACNAFFGAHKPARGVLAIAALHMGYRVAADLVAEVESR